MNLDFLRTPSPARPLAQTLSQIEDAQLIRRAPAESSLPPQGDPSYLFKHALVQDSAYASLMRGERKRLHRLVGEALSRGDADDGKQNPALLAYHFEQAEEWPRALLYLERAAEHARHGAAHREELALLARALSAAAQVSDPGVLERRAFLHARRGRAFASITQWDQAEAELLAALELVPSSDPAARAEILLDLAVVQNWLRKVTPSREAVLAARQLAVEAGRQDLAANALTVLAMSEAVAGELRSGVSDFDDAFARAPDLRSNTFVQAMEMAGLCEYWLARYPAALQRNREAVRRARELGDSVTIMRGLSNIGMTLAAAGEYGTALATFAEARAFGQAHGLGAWLARQVAIEGGLHLELFDFAGARELAIEARARARASGFIVAIVSPGVDLLFNFARTGHLHDAAAVEAGIVEALPSVTGSHVWLLGLRLAQARAELAAARLEWPVALQLADRALELARFHGRLKYEAAALGIRSRARAALGDSASADDARAAVALARASGDPALFVQAALAALRLREDVNLRREVRAVASRISRALPDMHLADGFASYVADWL